MNPSFIPEAIWQALGWAMLHFLWVGGVVALAFFVIERCALHRANSSTRYLFGVVGLMLLGFCAAVCVARELPGEPAPRALADSSAAAMAMAEAVPGTRATDHPEPRVQLEPAALVPSMAKNLEPVAAWPATFDWLAILPWIWLVGSTALACVLGLGLVGTWRLRRIAESSQLVERCEQLRRRLGIRIRVGVAVSRRVATPFVIGVLRPTIVMPASALSGMSPEMVEWILLHELAHVRRWDNSVIVFQRGLECVLFFHPAVWIVSHWISREREFCCDEFALANNPSRAPASYAATLASLAGVSELPLLVPASPMASHAVVHRIRKILTGQKPRPRGGAGALAGVFLVGLASAATMVGAFSEPQQDDTGPAKTEQTVAADEIENTELIARSFPVPRDVRRHLGGYELTVQEWLEKQGVTFPDGAFALYEARATEIVVRHQRVAIESIEKLVEANIPAPQPQLLCNAKLEWREGKKVREISARSVGTSNCQRARLENIKEQIYPTGGGKFDVANLGLTWENEPELKPGIKIAVAGEVTVLVPKGAHPAEFFEDWDFEQGPKSKPEWDVYRAPYSLDVKPGEPIEIPLSAGSETQAQRPEGNLVGVLTMTIVDPLAQHAEPLAGLPKPMVTDADLRKVFPLFNVVSHDVAEPSAEEQEQARLLAAGALVAMDLGDFDLAEKCAGSALALEPESAARLELWKQTAEMRSRATAGDSPFRSADPPALPGAWADRSYRLRPPLLPEKCLQDEAELRAFLAGCGLGFPSGATAGLSADGSAVLIHNQLGEFQSFEAGLKDRVLLIAGIAVTATVEVYRGVEGAEDLSPSKTNSFGLTGVFTDPQMAVIRRDALSEAEKLGRAAEKQIVSGGRQLNVLDGFPIEHLSILLGTNVDPDRHTIEGNFGIEQFEKAGDNDARLSLSFSTNSLTVWDGQWIALGGMTKDGSPLTVFVRLQIAP